MNGQFTVRDRTFAKGTHIMGILNATPDSFYPLSRLNGDAASRALSMLNEGADIIDIGGQSTRPGCKPVSALEELSRVLPVVEAVREATDAPISVDTFYPEVADAVLRAGADMINDVSGLADAELARVAAEYGAAMCIMHNRRGSAVPDLMTDKLTGLMAAADAARRAGVRADGILLDGGVGFNLNHDEDRYLLEHYGMLSAAGYPLLLGASRKSVFGGEVQDRLTATMESSARAARQGILFVRVHDVRENRMAIDAALGEDCR